MGPFFNVGKPLEICAIPNVSSATRQRRKLTKGNFNNAFPSSNPDGSRFVFRSTRDGGDKKHKNLYIAVDAEVGQYSGGTVTQLTNGG
jgi:Tol biopolymer transport system component